ncbi:tRNA lysidine(34) synthetase TilS [Roseovarius phycicola]|uniref:tRNA(Ile)-lysidine synthase n=1 Tax=Roseovarius phycicola TaxID=3080976 RepID=A0ABZ2HED9_9RHOB
MLLVKWADQGGPPVHAVTVDHNLRAESAREAKFVKDVCARIGVHHDTLVWEGRRSSGNLPDAARRARYSLMADWAEERGIPKVAVAHTQNDQAETFLMRLSREAGVDGLAAMSKTWRHGLTEFCRPVLGVERAELRGYLNAIGQDWIDDPTNEDEIYERTRARNAIDALSDLGLSPRSLATVAQHMSDVRGTLYWYVFLTAREHAQIDRGDVIFPRKQFRTLQRDISSRLLQKILKWISGADYAPRGRSVDFMLEAIRGGTGMTLHGCEMTVSDEALRFTREAQAVEGHRSSAGDIWDGRWKLDGPWPKGAEIAMLGEDGLAECPAWRQSGMPATSLKASPAVWRDGHLVAAPLSGLGNGWTASLLRDQDHFFAALLAH